MTAGQGYPDWQDYPNWRAPVFAAGNKVVTSVAPFTVSEWVTNWASLYLKVFISGGTGVTVDLSWYTDSGMATLIDTEEWTLNISIVAINTLSVLLPCLTNYFKLTISTGQVGNQQVTVYCAPTNSTSDAHHYPTPGNVTSVANQNIGAGVSFSQTLPQVMEGYGYLEYGQRGALVASTIFILESLEGGGPFSRILVLANAPLQFSFQFAVNTHPITVQITNNSAGAANYDFRCATISR